MRRRGLAPWLKFLLVALILALGSGAGLPGLVRAMAATSNHVCTCTSGGAHSSCPICNPSLHERDPVSAIDGVPCGERPTALGDACEPAIAPVVGSKLSIPVAYLRLERDVLLEPATVFLEPGSPPPRYLS